MQFSPGFDQSFFTLWEASTGNFDRVDVEYSYVVLIVSVADQPLKRVACNCALPQF